MAKLWQKNYDLNSLIEAFTVGRDYLLDQKLVGADVLASLAQAFQLAKMGLLTETEKNSLHQGLLGILRDVQKGTWEISPQDEDGHTAIENRLTQVCGEAGKKIHTGRSRNDQVITALRVYGRSAFLARLKEVCGLVISLLELARNHALTPMPGRTHMQIGMPSSVGLWAGAWAEELLDGAKLGHQLWLLWNQCPLGSAASYGVPLPLDREYTAGLLGFFQVQNNVLYVNNSRGKYESQILEVLDQWGLTFSKMAQDMILFSLPEFGYFTLPAGLCSGSSIMPQKKNPDGLELMRAKSATLGAYAQTVKGILRSLPSGYNRDFQETKEPFLLGLDLAQGMIAVMDLTIRELQVNPDALKKGFTPDIYATDAAFEKVLQGQSFRDAYREVGLNLGALEHRSPESTLQNRTHLGAPGNLGLEAKLTEAQVLKETLLDLSQGLARRVIPWAGEEFWHLTGLAVE